MIQFHADIDLIIAEAGDDNRPARIAGIAVPWDVVATVSGGQRVKFLRGAFDLNQKPAKLLENHDMGQLRGVVTSISDSDAGLEFEATLARTRASADVVALLQAGAYDSVSVGANPIQFKFDKAGVMIVSKAQMIELSLVAVPAFSEAVITEIAASADPEESEEEEETLDTPEEEKVSEAIKAESAESATTPTSPILYAQAKQEFKLPSAGEWISAQMQGGAIAAEFNARVRAAAPDVTTADLDGILPLPILAPIYSGIQGLRPVVDAIGARQMPQSGKVFIVAHKHKTPPSPLDNSLSMTSKSQKTSTADTLKCPRLQLTGLRQKFSKVSSRTWAKNTPLPQTMQQPTRFLQAHHRPQATSPRQTLQTGSPRFTLARQPS